MEFNFDFDEDDPLVQAQVKQRKTLSQKTVVNYIPKHDYAEVSRTSTTNITVTCLLIHFFYFYVPHPWITKWFHAPNPTPPSVLLQTKHGANHLKYSIEYHYAHGNYTKALEVSLEFINFVKHSSENVRNLHGTRDLYETAARSAVRLGEYEQAVGFVNEIVSISDGVYIFLCVGGGIVKIEKREIRIRTRVRRVMIQPWSLLFPLYPLGQRRAWPFSTQGNGLFQS